MTDSLRHLIVCREFPPATYPAGGIGTYTHNIAHLLAAADETVHVIGERWSGAPEAREELFSGRLVVHRIRLDEPLESRGGQEGAPGKGELALLGASSFPAQRFAWQAARLAERLVEEIGIDVIEGPEWEGPLYYLMLRRALGLGPARQPPCIIHLHSPTEFTFRHNEWSTARPKYLPTVRQEEYCIGAADALICPSHFLAKQLARRYAIPVDRIGVIPYPIGDFPLIPRGPEAWGEYRIVYVGRLEPRKGLIEFVEAAVEVAHHHPAVCFDFVGDDSRYRGTLSVRRYMESRIPKRLSHRFRFHGWQPRARLPALLAPARAAVIPSRWENFPNSCIEAMASGLPVIVSPNGGMSEVVEDGVSGWIAASPTPKTLATALRRALETKARDCEAMGRAAAEAIRGHCGNEIITRRHLARRAEVARCGPIQSAGIPDRLGIPPVRPPALQNHRVGLGIVVDALEDGRSATALHSIERQGVPPVAITVLNQAAGTDPAPDVLSGAIRAHVEEFGVAGVALVPGSARLVPDFVATAVGILATTPSLGILSGWVEDGVEGFLRPCPAFPYQWIANDVAEVAVVRAEAFISAGGLRQLLPPNYARWDLYNAILAAGWKAATLPAVLAAIPRPSPSAPLKPEESEVLLRALRERFPEAFVRDADTVTALTAPSSSDGNLRIREVLKLPIRVQVLLVSDAVRNPGQALRWLRERWGRGSG